MPVYNKLVRDRIPEIIKASGKQCRVAQVTGKDFIVALQKKLLEEVEEFLHSDCDLEELADILEVVEALAAQMGSNLGEIMELKAVKKEKRGGFEKGIWLEWVED